MRTPGEWFENDAFLVMSSFSLSAVTFVPGIDVILYGMIVRRLFLTFLLNIPLNGGCPVVECCVDR